MIRVIEQRESTTCDCWGRPEYDTVYVVIDENNRPIGIVHLTDLLRQGVV